MSVRYSPQFFAQLVDAAAYLVPRRLDRREDHPALGLELRAQCAIGGVHGAFRDAVLGVRSPKTIFLLGLREHGLGCLRGIEVRVGDQLVLASDCLNVLDCPGQSAFHDVWVETFALGPCGDRFPDLFLQLLFLRRSTPGFLEELHQLTGGAHSNRSERSAQGADRDGCQRVHQLGPPRHRHELRPPSSTPVEPVPVSRPTRRPRQRDCPTVGRLAMYVVVTVSVVLFGTSSDSSPEPIRPGRLSTMIDKPGLEVCFVDHDRHGPRLPQSQRHRAREHRGLPAGGPAGRIQWVILGDVWVAEKPEKMHVEVG